MINSEILLLILNFWKENVQQIFLLQIKFVCFIIYFCSITCVNKIKLTFIQNDLDPAYKDELAALIKDTDRIVSGLSFICFIKFVLILKMCYQLLSDDEEELDEDEDEALMAEFSLHKENYYRNKLDYNVVTE